MNGGKLMSVWSMLVLVSPVLLLLVITGVVLLTALFRVPRTEVPTVLSVCSTVLCRFADRVTYPRQHRRLLDGGPSTAEAVTRGKDGGGQ